MRQNVHRFYDATPEFNQGNPIGPLTAAQVQALAGYPVLWSIKVPPSKPFHTIWAYLYHDNSALAFIHSHLVGKLNGREVYREVLIKQTNTTWTSSKQEFYSTLINSVSAVGWPGTVCESVRVVINGVQWECMPLVINCTVDTWEYQVQGISGAVTTWTGNLFVRSQAGI